jgi:hypothetical protein
MDGGGCGGGVAGGREAAIREAAAEGKRTLLAKREAHRIKVC